MPAGPLVHAPRHKGTETQTRKLKLDESCTLNPKSEISNWTASARAQSNLIIRISDLRCRIRPISISSLLESLSARDSLAFYNRENLVGLHVLEHIDHTTGPTNFKAVRPSRLIQPEVHSQVVLSQITGTRLH